MILLYNSCIYPKESKSAYYRDYCTPMFIAALSTTDKLWNQPMCPLMSEWIRKFRLSISHKEERNLQRNGWNW
jgi:hypothetical protein